MLTENKLGFIPTEHDTELVIHDYGGDVDQLLVSKLSVLRKPENLSYLKDKHDLLGELIIKLEERKAA